MVAVASNRPFFSPLVGFSSNPTYHAVSTAFILQTRMPSVFLSCPRARFVPVSRAAFVDMPVPAPAATPPVVLEASTGAACERCSCFVGDCVLPKPRKSPPGAPVGMFPKSPAMGLKSPAYSPAGLQSPRASTPQFPPPLPSAGLIPAARPGHYSGRSQTTRPSDRLVGKLVSIMQAGYRGYKGRVKHATDTHVQVSGAVRSCCVLRYSQHKLAHML